jgi:ADP-L-glycero-D-manno-heptose 6-epimerase
MVFMKYIDDSLEDKKILITGGAGFIGSALARHIEREHPSAEVVVLDRFRDGSRFENGNLKSLGHYKNLLDFSGEIWAGDINDDKVMEEIKKRGFDIIYHKAAISDTTVTNQEIMIKTNVNAFKNLLDIAIEHKSTIVYASSGATYGDAPSPQRVGCEKPNNVYGFSKLMMDRLAQKYMRNSPHTRIVGLRYFNVYGEGEYFKGNTASMVLQFGLQILDGKAPRLFEGSDEIKRDFVYIEDVIQANMRALESKSGIYNVATGKARSFQEIADILQKLLGVDLGSEYIKNPYIGRYQFFTQADIKDTTENLGYRPRYTLEKGIEAYLESIKNIYKSEVKDG